MRATPTAAPGAERGAESPEWEAAYRLTRRSLRKRRRRLHYFDWPMESGNVLDLASGDGLDLQVLGEIAHGFRIGLDISADLLGRAEGARVVADAHRLPFSSGSLGIVLANSVMHHLAPPTAFEELGRVLRPGGLLLMIEPRPCLARSLLDWFTLSFAPGQMIPFFRARRASLMEEMDVYSHWLSVYSRVPGWLMDTGFSLEREKQTLVAWLSQWRKA